MKRLVVAATAAASAAILAVVFTQSTAVAEAPHGHHVAVCAQDHGFDRTHHPGMHRGFSDGHHAHCAPGDGSSS